jgi:DNA-directed RNA polymerase subunit K/omega
MSKNINSEYESSIDTEDVVSDSENFNCIYNDIIDDIEDKKKKELKGIDRITRNKLTRYELVRIIGERTKQLSMGAKPLIIVNNKSEDLSYKEIAIEELKLNMLPFKIKRPHINSYEIWNLNELEKDHLESFLV